MNTIPDFWNEDSAAIPSIGSSMNSHHIYITTCWARGSHQGFVDPELGLCERHHEWFRSEEDLEQETD